MPNNNSPGNAGVAARYLRVDCRAVAQVRVTEPEYELLETAARLRRQRVNQFCVSCALEAARAIVAEAAAASQ